MTDHYVYTHAKPDGTVFYVGKGKNRRAWNMKRVGNPHHAAIVAKYGESAISVAVYRVPDEGTALSLECEIIAEYRAMGVRLSNITLGGEGTSGRPMSEKTKAVLDVYRRMPRSAATIAKIVARQTGRVKSLTERANIAASLRGKKRPAHVIEALVKHNTGRPLPLSAKPSVLRCLEPIATKLPNGTRLMQGKSGTGRTVSIAGRKKSGSRLRATSAHNRSGRHSRSAPSGAT